MIGSSWRTPRARQRLSVQRRSKTCSSNQHTLFQPSRHQSHHDCRLGSKKPTSIKNPYPLFTTRCWFYTPRKKRVFALPHSQQALFSTSVSSCVRVFSERRTVFSMLPFSREHKLTVPHLPPSPPPIVIKKQQNQSRCLLLLCNHSKHPHHKHQNFLPVYYLCPSKKSSEIFATLFYSTPHHGLLIKRERKKLFTSKKNFFPDPTLYC